ncbi:hypothetical protein EKO04_010614 [Ascochyta lentis]|uniref:Uncharacterized protein n=1 Tax=Ascochyta lentis TaxID=205686 RepID=A0A8H7IUI1_9PLEO|nr:hypothetical protein EKO04_010614 [Ascochyta lentis]
MTKPRNLPRKAKDQAPPPLPSFEDDKDFLSSGESDPESPTDETRAPRPKRKRRAARRKTDASYAPEGLTTPTGSTSTTATRQAAAVSPPEDLIHPVPVKFTPTSTGYGSQYEYRCFRSAEGHDDKWVRYQVLGSVVAISDVPEKIVDMELKEQWNLLSIEEKATYGTERIFVMRKVTGK